LSRVRINLSKRLYAAFLLANGFCDHISHRAFSDFLTQSAYSTPDAYVFSLDGMGITIGPKPNSTNVPLDTTIAIDTWRSPTVSDFNLMPEAPIARLTKEKVGLASMLTTFYPAEPLKPATTCNVSVVIMNVPVSWSFATTSEPYHPTSAFYLVTYALWIALSAAIATTLLVGLAIWFRRKRV